MWCLVATVAESEQIFKDREVVGRFVLGWEPGLAILAAAADIAGPLLDNGPGSVELRDERVLIETRAFEEVVGTCGRGL